MFPQELFLGLTLYDILICVGIVLCFFVFGFLADKMGLKAKFQKFCYLCGVVAIICGLGSAVLFQALYNIAERGRFEITLNTGSTFYGGLIGGVAVFLAAYFIIGKFYFKKAKIEGYHKENFFKMASCAMPSIAIAHGFGRLGCLMAGCCHGSPTFEWFGIFMHGDQGYLRYIPIQLFEAIFLFFTFALLAINAWEGKRYNLSIYMAVYGVWRFIIEFTRGDYRGSVGLPITPSQLIALIMIIGSVAVFIVEKKITDKSECAENKKSAVKDEK